MGRDLYQKIEYSTRYLLSEGGLIKSIFPNIGREYLYGNELIYADLHCHPYIENEDDLRGVLCSSVRNWMGIIGWTKHVGSDEKDYFDMKDILVKSSIKYNDKDLAVFVPTCGEIPLVVLGNYETNVKVKGLKEGASIDMLALMPDIGFRKTVRNGMPLDEFLDVADHYKAIKLLAHACVLPVEGKIPFRSPEKEELEFLIKEIIPKIDGADEVADATLWMSCSWDQDYYSGQHTLRSSDAHTRIAKGLKNIPLVNSLIKSYLRNEIGRAYTMFNLDSINEMDDLTLREELRTKIRNHDFLVGGGFTPLGQFFLGTTLPRFL